MNDTSAETSESATGPAAPIADSQPEHEDHLQHAKSSLIHAVENVVDKVTDAFGNLGGRK